MQDMFMRKYGYLAQEIAKKMLTISVGERIPKISDLAEEFSIGRGTVQGALKILEKSGAISTNARGHLGTFLTAKDQKLLLQVSGFGQLVGAMPLPYSKKYEGLATGLSAIFDKHGYTLHFAFMRGSVARAKALTAGRYDFAIMSLLAAEKLIQSNAPVEIALSLGKQSYVSGHTVFVGHDQIKELKDGMKIGIDSSSTDQVDLTMAECENLDVEFVEANYMHLFDMLAKGEIDAAVWDNEDTRQNISMPYIPLSTRKAKEMDKKLTEAVCLVHTHNSTLKEVLGTLPLEDILNIQKAVIEGTITPRY